MMRKTLLLLSLLCLASAWASAGTVAYWRFEDGVSGNNVEHLSGQNGIWSGDIQDVSGNGNHLSVWQTGGGGGYAYRDETASPMVPLMGELNKLSVRHSGGGPAMWCETTQMQTMTPAQWTIEATFKLENGGNKTIVGRDSFGANLYDVNGNEGGSENLAALYFQLAGNNAMVISYCDVAGYWHSARSVDNVITGYNFNDSPEGVGAPWYSAAAVSDGQTLSLYLLAYANPEAGYQLIAQADLTASGSPNTALTAGSDHPDGRTDWEPGDWSVGRGLWAAGHVDRAYGFIDEVRISDSALSVSEFLGSGAALAGPEDRGIFLEDMSSITFTADVAAFPIGATLTSVDWYKDTPDPNTLIVSDGVKYVVDTTADQSNLTIYNVNAADAAQYKAKATFSDGTVVTSPREGRLSIRQGLVHRYSFTSDASDSVGTADGVIVDPNAILDPRVSFAGGQMLLDNYAVNANPADANEIAYVEFPAGIISSLDNFMTIEVWLTPHRNADWTPIFGFGRTWNEDPFTDGFNGARNGILGQLNRNGGTTGPAFNRVANGQLERFLIDQSPILTLDEAFMYAVTWDGNTNRMRLYVNGVQQASAPIDMRLSDIEDTMCRLGLGFWPDQVLNASVNEMRIYDTALPGYYINAHYQVGPDVTNVELKPIVGTPRDVAVYPALRHDDNDAAQFTAAVNEKPAGSTVTGAQWYLDPDPAISGDEIALNNGGKYTVTYNDDETTLTIYDINAADEGHYYASVTINTGSAGSGGSAKLTVSEGLVHRWSFNGDLTDSVNGADGSLVDPSGLASFTGGQLRLENPEAGPNADPDGVAYVSLPAGIISALDNYATIEMWVTPHAKPGSWLNMFAFGSDRDGDPRNYTGGDGIIGTLRSEGTDAPVFSFDVNGAQRWQVSEPAELNQEMLFAMVWDGNTNTGTLYVIDSRGTQVASAAIEGNRVLANVDDTVNIIGGNWWNDYMLNGSINELRIYDWPFEQPWIQEHYLVGPDTVDVNPCLVRPRMDVAGGGEFGDEPDCQVTLADFMALASKWLECGRLEACD